MNKFAVTPELVRHIAKLASLDLLPKDETHFVEELNHVLGYMAQLEKLDTEKIEATFQPFQATNVMREDELGPTLLQEEALQNAPEREDIYFKMPPILDGEQ